MTLRDFVNAAWTTLVEDFRRTGMNLHEATTAIAEVFSPELTPEEQAARDREAEAERMKENERTMAAMMSYGGGRPG